MQALKPDALFSSLEHDLSQTDRLTGWQLCARDLILRNFLKKLEPDRHESTPDSRAHYKFLLCNSAARKFQLVPNTSLDEALIGEFKRSVDQFLHPQGNLLVESYSDVARRGQCGPGVAIGSYGNDFYTKLFSSEMATTQSDLYEVYLRVSRETDLWRSAEILRRRQFGLPLEVEGSRLSFAPKYRDISRVICIEPSLNMFFQLGLSAILQDRLRSYFGIDLSLQPAKNRDLARWGSLTDSNFTIDLESASDSVSNRLVLDTFPGWFRDILNRLRSPVTTCGGHSLELDILSSMGNGFTFPLQTMIFSCVVDAAARLQDVRLEHPFGNSHGNWGVFGDDIIAPSALWHRVNRLLSLLGFTVNASKSFAEGPFRESCGGDFYNGRLVRAVYVKSIRSTPERYSLLNRLSLWSATTDIPIPRTIAALRRAVPWRPVPWYEDDSSGIKVPASYPRKRVVNGNGTEIAWPLLADVPKIRIVDRSFRLPQGAKPRWFNPAGVLAVFLEGRLVKGSIGYRKEPRYRQTKRVYPSWDHASSTDIYTAPRRFPGGDRVFRRWETTVLTTL